MQDRFQIRRQRGRGNPGGRKRALPKRCAERVAAGEIAGSAARGEKYARLARVRLHCRARAGRRGPSPGVCRFAWGGGAGEAGRVIDLAYWPDASAAASVPRAIGFPSGREEGTIALEATY